MNPGRASAKSAISLSYIDKVCGSYNQKIPVLSLILNLFYFKWHLVRYRHMWWDSKHLNSTAVALPTELIIYHSVNCLLKRYIKLFSLALSILRLIFLIRDSNLLVWLSCPWCGTYQEWLEKSHGSSDGRAAGICRFKVLLFKKQHWIIVWRLGPENRAVSFNLFDRETAIS